MTERVLFQRSHFKVRWVDDGDTILLEDGRHVRYIGIDSPEIGNASAPGEPFGKEALLFNRNRVLHQRVKLEQDVEKKDRYGRVLAYVFLPDNTFMNLQMVESGHAVVRYQKPNIRFHSMLLDAQRKAMASKKGIWSAFQEDGGIRYTGNRNSMRFHKMDCPLGKKISAGNRIGFKSRWDAFWEGYSPCRECFQIPAQ
ncbi:MAG: thermonuclease family protein [Thermodesulfobacteriota bacterium]